MAMFEDVTRSQKGRVFENSFMQYKIPSRLEIPDLQVEFESSYEPTGPFGAKSIGGGYQYACASHCPGSV